jgi:hypothetical protein
MRFDDMAGRTLSLRNVPTVVGIGGHGCRWQQACSDQGPVADYNEVSLARYMELNSQTDLACSPELGDIVREVRSFGSRQR